MWDFYEPAVGNLNIDIAPKITLEDIPEHWAMPNLWIWKRCFCSFKE